MLDKLHENQFKDMPAMFIYTSGTTGRPKVGMSRLKPVIAVLFSNKRHQLQA